MGKHVFLHKIPRDKETAVHYFELPGGGGGWRQSLWVGIPAGPPELCHPGDSTCLRFGPLLCERGDDGLYFTARL